MNFKPVMLFLFSVAIFCLVLVLVFNHCVVLGCLMVYVLVCVLKELFEVIL